MRTLIWKELRENAPWWMVMQVCFTAILLTQLYSITAVTRFSDPLNFYSDLPFTFLVAGGLIAIVLALLQTYPERQPDRWAFLLHRELSPASIFWAKATAAIVFFVALVCVGLMIIVGCFVTYGYERFPFEWRMLLPLILASFAGFGFYFPIYHIVLRERIFPLWRLLPLALPFAGLIAFHVYVAHFIDAFWWALLIITTLTVMGAFIASQTIMRQGCFLNTTQHPLRLLFACNYFTVLILLFTAFVCGQLMTEWVAFEYLGYDRISVMHSGGYTSIGPWLDKDGDACHAVFDHESHSSDVFTLRSIRTLRQPESNKHAELIGKQFTFTTWCVDHQFSALGIHENRGGSPGSMERVNGFGAIFFQSMNILRSQQQVIRRQHAKFATPNSTNHSWNWSLSDTHGVVLAYSEPKERLVDGEIEIVPAQLEYVVGPDGFFRYPAWPKQRFGKCVRVLPFKDAPHSHASHDGWAVLLFENGIYQIDVVNRSVSELFRSSDGDELQNIVPFGDDDANVAVFRKRGVDVYEPVLHLAADSVDSDINPDSKLGGEPPLTLPPVLIPGDLIARIRYPEGVSGSVNLGFGFSAERNIAWFSPALTPSDLLWDMSRSFVEVDLETFQAKRIKTSPSAVLNEWYTARAAAFCTAIPLAPAGFALMLGELRYLTTGHWPVTGMLFHGIQGPAFSYSCIAALLLSSLICACVGWRISARYGIESKDRRRWVWVGLMLGPAGIIALASIHTCPARVRCESCQRKRLVTQASCRHCHAAFPSPEVNGTEVFAATA